MTESEIEAIRARLRAATGPFVLTKCSNHPEPVYTRCLGVDDSKGVRVFDSFANIELIAHAPTDIAALLAEVERLREDNARQRVSLNEYKSALANDMEEIARLRERLGMNLKIDDSTPDPEPFI